MENTVTAPAKRCLPAAIGLFFIAPFIAEFLLGDLPITMLPVVLVLAPVYGGGALLIREVARRTGGGWPAIVLMALAYGIVEEAFTTQSLFNPDYLHLHLHLLQPAFIPALGIGGWWTIFVLTLHTAWSISTSIALVEATVPDRASMPWLGPIGLVLITLLFALGLVATTRYQLHQDPFRASRAQFLISGSICVALVILAFLLPKRGTAEEPGRVPNPWITAAFALLAGSTVLLTPGRWRWGAAALILAVDACVAGLVLLWSRRRGWDMRHKLGLASGAALAYGWHAFIGHPVVSGPLYVVRIGNGVFLLAVILLIYFGARRTSAWVRGSI